MTNYNLSNYSPWIRFDNLNWDNQDLAEYLKTFPANHVIYHQQHCSDYIYLVKEGRVRLSIFSNDGIEKCLVIAEKGSMFGEISILDNLPNFATATTIVQSSILLIPKEVFNNMLLRDTDILKAVIQSLATKVRVISSHIEDISFKSSYSRVACYLIKLVHSHGNYSAGIYKLNIKFTHQEMAELTGLSRVTVSTIMSDMISNGFISKADGYLIISDIYKLYDLI